MNTFEERIQEKLIKLPNNARLLFGILTCEKLRLNYESFVERTNWGDTKTISEAISLIYLYLINNTSISILEIEDMMANVDAITPDTDDFLDLTTSFALDTCTSLSATLEFIINKDIQNILDVSTFATDTVYAFINLKENFDPLDASSEIQIEHDDFMLQEKQRQMDLLNKLTSINVDKITDNLIDSLRDKRPIIDLSLLSEQ